MSSSTTFTQTLDPTPLRAEVLDRSACLVTNYGPGEVMAISVETAMRWRPSSMTWKELGALVQEPR